MICLYSLYDCTTVECPAPGDGFGTCVEACSSDSNCTNGQLCCSNGCGHECMTPVVNPCAVSIEYFVDHMIQHDIERKLSCTKLS